MNSPRSPVIAIAARIFAAAILVVVLMGVPMIGRWGANLFRYDTMDPDGAFAITLFARWVTARRLHPLDGSWSTTRPIYATALGYFYGDCYERSGSVVYPIDHAQLHQRPHGRRDHRGVARSVSAGLTLA